MRQPSITIIGAGFGGVGTAIELKRAGYTDITVLEKAGGVVAPGRVGVGPNQERRSGEARYSFKHTRGDDSGGYGGEQRGIRGMTCFGWDQWGQEEQ